jgi:hypothetical protein
MLVVAIPLGFEADIDRLATTLEDTELVEADVEIGVPAASFGGGMALDGVADLVSRSNAVESTVSSACVTRGFPFVSKKVIAGSVFVNTVRLIGATTTAVFAFAN